MAGTESQGGKIMTTYAMRDVEKRADLSDAL